MVYSSPTCRIVYAKTGDEHFKSSISLEIDVRYEVFLLTLENIEGSPFTH